MICGGNNICNDGSNGIFGVCVALGTDVFLGGDGHYWIFFCYSLLWGQLSVKWPSLKNSGHHNSYLCNYGKGKQNTIANSFFPKKKSAVAVEICSNPSTTKYSCHLLLQLSNNK